MALDPDPRPRPKPKPKKRRLPPPPPPAPRRPQRSVERPGSSSQERNPRSLRSYAFLRANSGVNWKGVEPALLQKLNALGRRTGNVITLTSGFRTHAEQRRLYAAYLRGEIGLAAPPGRSNHEHGDAVDALIDGVPIAQAVDEATLNAMGMKSLAHLGDAVHVELSSGHSGGGGGSAATPAPSVMATQQNVTPQSAPVEYAAPEYAPAPTPEMADALPYEVSPDEAPVELLNAQQRAETWQLIAQQPGASPESQTLARLARLSIGG